MTRVVECLQVVTVVALLSACAPPDAASGAATSSSAATGSSGGAGGASSTSTTGAGGYPAPVLDQATTYQINATHTGNQSGDNLAPPLKQRWTLDLHGAISYPLIAGGRVFVTVANSDATLKPVGGTKLFALDQATGSTAWGPFDPGGSGMALAAYDSGQVFVVNSDGVVQALDAATGKVGWSVDLPNNTYFTSPPVATMGKVFLVGGAALTALDQGTGKVLWKHPIQASAFSSPIVSATAAFTAGPGSCAFSFPLSKGAPNWQLSDCASDLGGRTPALFEGTLYVRNPPFAPSGNLLFDAATGTATGTFEAEAIPAFHDKRGFFLSKGTLSAKDLPAQTQAWSFAGDGMLTSAPIVVNGHVYAGGSAGMLYALDEHTGEMVWSTDVGSPILLPYEDIDKSPTIAGIAAGGGALIVPAWSHLNAYW
ncbi:MAG: PQQ-binding-like beta-propeller repeat protein [Byssovorax sp.]